MIEKISDAAGGSCKPWQMKRIAQAEREIAIFEAEKVIQIEDISARAVARWMKEESRKQQAGHSSRRITQLVKRKGMKRNPSDESWWLRITSLKPSYSLAKNVFYGKDCQSDPFSESAVIEICAEVLEPTRFKTRTVEFNLRGDRGVARSLNDVYQTGLNPYVRQRR